jgi:hypothetical protein
VELGIGRVEDGRAEAQSAGRDVPAQQVGLSRLVERHPAGRQDPDLGLVGVDADHVVADLGHRRGVGRAEVARPDHRHPHAARSYGRAGRPPTVVGPVLRDTIGLSCRISGFR